MKDGLTVSSDGTKEWRVNGELHREDGPAIELPNGTKYWFINNKFHREDGPAIEQADGHKEWWVNGERHREDGPAIELPNDFNQYWLNGVEVVGSELRKIRAREEANIENTLAVL